MEKRERSRVERLGALPPAIRASFLKALSEEEAEALLYDWEFFARPSQLPPAGTWRIWLLLAGRGFGKTRSGAEYVRKLTATHGRIALIAPTTGDIRDVMIEGQSGLLAISPPWNRPSWEPSKRRLTWPNGAVASCYSADEPDRLRGPQHDAAWGDELAAWRYPESYDMLMLGLRLGGDPRAVFTTTPRPVKLIRDLLRDPHVAVTRGTTFDNATNLAPGFLDAIVARYEGTRLGRQELDGTMLDDLEGALWNRAAIEAARIDAAPPLTRIVVAVDPAVTWGPDADETGIVVVGLDEAGSGHVLEDLSGRFAPEAWARRAVAAWRSWGADRVVGEANQGGDLVAATLRAVDAAIPFRAVHASRGKVARAEPVAALYEQGRVRHAGFFPLLEDQMCAFTAGFDRAAAGFSPDRVDALVWGLSELMLGPASTGLIDYYRKLTQRKGPA